jgi:hypothetical protein
MLIKNALSSILFSLVLALLSYANAEQFKTDNGYVIHYNAISTELIPPEVARNNQITRSKNRAMLTVAVLKPSGDPKQLLHKSVTAQVTAQSVNLNQQLVNLDMRQIKDGDAIYYIGVFSVTNQDTLTFTLKVQPENQGKVQEITFRQQFFVD